MNRLGALRRNWSVLSLHICRKISTESRPRPQPRGRWIGSERFVVGSSRNAKSIPGCRLDKPTWRYLTSRRRLRSICRFPLGFQTHLEGRRKLRWRAHLQSKRRRPESHAPALVLCLRLPSWFFGVFSAARPSLLDIESGRARCSIAVRASMHGDWERVQLDMHRENSGRGAAQRLHSVNDRGRSR